MSKFNYGSFMIFAYVIARYTHIFRLTTLAIR